MTKGEITTAGSSNNEISMGSPYFLSHSDNPGASITPVTLTGENYAEWASELENALRAKRKIGFINGTLLMPDENEKPAEAELWKTVNSMIVGWIRTSISATVRSTVTFTPDAFKMWSELKRRFSIGNTVRVHQLKAELAACKQDGLTVLDYFGRLSSKWEELLSYKPLPTCTCGASEKINKDYEEEKVHMFLMGLDDARFGNVCTNIIGMDPLPDLNSVYQRVVREERRLLTSRVETKQDAVGFLTRSEVTHGDTGPAAVVTRSRGGVICSHCGRTGHEKKECWQIIGFPDWWTERNQGGDRTGRGRGGSRGRGRGQAQSNAMQAQVSGGTNVPALTAEQWASLTALLEQQKPTPIPEKLNGKKQTGEVILDTGASHHMTGDARLLSDMHAVVGCPVRFADGSQVQATRSGVLRLSEKITLPHVLLVPDLNCTLLSVAKLLKQTGCLAMFSDTLCVLQDRFTRTLIGAGEERGGVYVYRDVTVRRGLRVKGAEDKALWHRRLGHPSFGVLSHLPFVSGVSNHSDKFGGCDICFKSKQTRCVFSESYNKASVPFELIHVDLWGPYREPASCGAIYFLTIVDDCSRAVWIHLLLEKSEVKTVLPNFCSFAQRQFGRQVQTVRSDNGTEFLCLSKYFAESGIVHHTSCVATPQQNGRVERKHRHILNVSRSIMFQANLPIKFWGESVLTAAHLINQTPSSLLHGKSPYECLYGKSPSYDRIKTFGCLCYAHKSSRDKDKFKAKSRKCIFVGYPFGKKGWRLYDLENEEFFVSRDVEFTETSFPFRDDQTSSPAGLSSLHKIVEVHDPIQPVPESRGSNPETTEEKTQEDTEAVTETVESAGPVTDLEAPETEPTSEVLVTETEQPAVAETEQNLGRGHRVPVPLVKLRDYVTYNSQCSPDKHNTPPVLLAPSRHSEMSPGKTASASSYPITAYITDAVFSERHQAFLAAITAGVEPRNWREAMLDPVWNGAMSTEVVALEEQRTWDVTELPKGKKALICQWVYKYKYNADGTVERPKARLVVCGNRQVEGRDYGETFAPVAKITTVRTLLEVAVAKNWEVHQMDVHNAFLHGDLEEEVYMKMPPGFYGDSPTKVCKLRKSLYGLKQAPRCWFAKLTTALKKFGFKQSYSDYSLFRYIKDSRSLRVLIYVDDLIIAGDDLNMMTRFKAYLNEWFKMKDLGKAKYFLGIEIARGPMGMFLSQRKYALDIVAEAGLLGCKPVATPMEQNHKLLADKGPFYRDPVRFRRVVGRLVYLAITRPELSYTIHILSQVMHKPREAHWDAVVRVLKYLKGCPGQGIMLKAVSDLRIRAFCDSDWASCPLSRRSLSAFVVLLGDSPISWKTKKQDTVSHSSAEAEYRAMAATLRELKWLKRLLGDFGVKHSDPMQMFCDSKSAIYIATNPVFHERTKHIESDCHSVRDAVQDRLITFRHVRTTEQLADIMTKALGSSSFHYLLNKLGVRNLHAPT